MAALTTDDLENIYYTQATHTRRTLISVPDKEKKNKRAFFDVLLKKNNDGTLHTKELRTNDTVKTRTQLV